MITRALLKPGGNLRGFVGGVVVQPQRHRQSRRHGALDPVEEAQKFLLPVACPALADDFARGDVPRGEERGLARPPASLFPSASSVVP